MHHFERMVFPEHSHSGRALTQITVYAEMRNVTEDVFNEDDVLETRRRKRTDQISILLDRGRKEVDVVSIGGKPFLQKIAHAFCQSFASETPALEDLIRRPVHLQGLARRPVFELLPADEVKTVHVDEIRLKSPSGWLQTFERKSRTELTEDVYDIAEQNYGDRSPFCNDGWTVEGARIRLGGEPTKTGRNRKIRTVELKPNGHTNLLEHDANDRWIANVLFVRSSRGRSKCLWSIIKELDENESLTVGLNAAANMAIEEFRARNPDAKEVPGPTAAKEAVKLYRAAKASGEGA